MEFALIDIGIRYVLGMAGMFLGWIGAIFYNAHFHPYSDFSFASFAFPFIGLLVGTMLYLVVIELSPFREEDK